MSPLCADAHVLLASEAKTPAEEIAHYSKGVEAGARALGEAAFTELAGEFWGPLETRPYMRARHGLALALWRSGEREAAVGHYRDMLRLNPNDNQGIRYCLMDALLELGRNDEAADLLKLYEDDAAAAWAWSAALLSFRREQDSPQSRALLAAAIETNPHVPDYLLGRQPLPADMPDYIGLGDEREAVSYVAGAAAAWRATAGALAWVGGEAGASAPVASRPLRVRGQLMEAGFDTDRVDDAVLALLTLGLHDGWRAWKSFDWDAMDRLHRKEMISNPVGKAKSVVFTDEGLERAQQLFEALFARKP